MSENILRNSANLISKFGSVDVFEYKENLPIPVLDDNQVLVEVKFAGVNPVDAKTRSGLGWGAKKIANNFPAILGMEISGTVVYSNSSEFKPSDRVCAMVNGGYCKYVAVNSNYLVKIPDEVSLQDAAVLPCAGMTAWQILKKIDFKNSEKILISAPLGGVGHFLMQMLQEKNCKITAITSSAKEKLVKSKYKCDIICYDQSDAKYDANADIFIDLVGGEFSRIALNALNKNAKVICVPTIAVEELSQYASKQGIKVEGILVENNQDDLHKLLKLLKEGKIKPEVNAVFPLSQAAKAHQIIENAHTIGKIVLQV